MVKRALCKACKIIAEQNCALKSQLSKSHTKTDRVDELLRKVFPVLSFLQVKKSLLTSAEKKSYYDFH